MAFVVAVVFFSAHGLLVTLANIIAEGARKVVLLFRLVQCHTFVIGYKDGSLMRFDNQGVLWLCRSQER